MRKAEVRVHSITAGILEVHDSGRRFCFVYDPDYEGPPISLTLPKTCSRYEFNAFPPFFDGLLPEGPQLEALLKQNKIDRNDFFSQLVAVGQDMVGAVTVHEI
nr:HipA N-terminal domain-containing protein [Desulfobulbaceae bacterium]